MVIDVGNNWVTLKLKNIGSETLKELDVQLHSLDTYNLTVYGTGLFGEGRYLPSLESCEEREVYLKVNAVGSSNVYITIKARKDGTSWWWESGRMNLRVSEEKAEIGRLLVLSNPYTIIGKTISAEATIKGLRESTGLKLEFWVDTPVGGNFEEQATIDIKDLPVGEEARYTAEFTPKETGYYTIYAYLYDGWRRIGSETETIYAQKE
jgi:hypothetical protein